MSIAKPLPTPALSVVVPCYNEEGSLPELHRRVSAVCRSITDSHEILLVNDGSKDKTWQIILQLAASDPHIVGVNLSRNHGHQLALTAGLSVCRGDRVMVIDADLQDPPELLTQMMAEIDRGADVVYGQRRSRAGESFFKKASASAFYRLLNKLVDVEIPVDTGDFRLMTRQVVDELNKLREVHRFIRGMVSWLGFRQVALQYDRDKRYAGTTNYPLRKMLMFALDAATSFSTVPLRIATYLGGLFCAISAIGIVYAIVSFFIGTTVAGWTSVLILLLLVAGVQLFIMGIIGEYVGRLYMQSKARSLFIVKEIVAGPVVKDGLASPVAVPHDLVRG